MNTKKLFSLLAIAFCCQMLPAQSYQCGTDQSDTFMQELRENKKSFEKTRNKSRVERFIPITFHSISNTQGEGRAPDQLILDAMCTLNQRYEDTEMRFYLQDINYINSTNLYESPGGNQGRTEITNTRSSNSLNVYVVDFAGTGVGGYYTRNLDVVVVLKTTLGDDRYTLEHELGHFFTLPHTHRGWDQIASDPSIQQGGYDPEIHGDTVTITSVSSSQSGSTLIELVDGSNCTTAADEICDTPPDYGFGFTCNCCTMIFDVWDSNGDKIEPMIDNVMSYSNNCNPYRFSEEQVTAMLTDYDSNRRNYLRGGDVDVYNPITEKTVLLSPSFGSVVENYNGVFFDWDDVPNAEQYIVRIDGDIGLEFVTTTSELFVEDLEANGTYFWQVSSSNRFGSSCLTEDVVIFNTGSGTTSVNDIKGFSNVGIHPNPVESGVDLNIFITSDKSLNVRSALIDITGKVIMSQNDIIQNGNNQIKLRTSSIASGLYVVEVQTENGRITEKVFIK